MASRPGSFGRRDSSPDEFEPSTRYAGVAIGAAGQRASAVRQNARAWLSRSVRIPTDRPSPRTI